MTAIISDRALNQRVRTAETLGRDSICLPLATVRHLLEQAGQAQATRRYSITAIPSDSGQPRVVIADPADPTRCQFYRHLHADLIEPSITETNINWGGN